MTQQAATNPSTAPESVAVGHVYVLTEHMHEGDTVLYITTSLSDAQTFHARNPIRTQVQPWEPVILRSEIDDEPHTWRTRPISGGYGAIYYIVKTPLHAPLSVAADVLTDALTGAAGTAAPASAAGSYRPWLGEVAPGVTSFSDPRDPDRHVPADKASEIPTKNPTESPAVPEGDRYTRLRDGILALIPTDDSELIDAGYEVLASDILDVIATLDAKDTTLGLVATSTAHTRLDPSLATMGDAEAFRHDFYIAVPSISDSALLALMNNNPHLLALAREWGWNETQVRDEFAAVLEANGHTLD